MKLGAISTASTWLWNEFGIDFLQSTKEMIERKYNDEKERSDKFREFERRWQNFNWGDSADRYKKHLQEIYGYIRMIGTTEPIPSVGIFPGTN